MAGGVGIVGNAYIGGSIYLGANKGVYVNGQPLSTGGGGSGMTTTPIDFTISGITGGTNDATLKTGFYAIEIIPQKILDADPTFVVDSRITIPLEFYITGKASDAPDDEVTLYGCIRPIGVYSGVHTPYYDITQTISTIGDSRFHTIYGGQQNYSNIVIYARGGYKYWVTTNGTIGYYPRPSFYSGFYYGDSVAGVRFIGGFLENNTASPAPGIANANQLSFTTTFVTGLNNNTQNMNKTIRNNGFIINDTTASTTATTGALVVAGGVGIGGCVSSSSLIINNGLYMLRSNGHHLDSYVSSGYINEGSPGHIMYLNWYSTGDVYIGQINQARSHLHAYGGLSVFGRRDVAGTSTLNGIPSTNRVNIGHDCIDAYSGGIGNSLALNYFSNKGVRIGNTTGKLGVNCDPTNPIQISEETGTVPGPTSGTLVLEHGNGGGTSSIVFVSATNKNSDYGYISYRDASVAGGAGESARLIIGTQNDNDDHIILSPSGNVGIGTETPTTKLHVSGDVTATSYNANSDSRIKSNILSINSEFSLDSLRKLKPSSYNLIEKPDKLVYGFIAQEVKDVIPEAASIATNYVPSIYENAFIEGNKITLINKTVGKSWKKIRIAGQDYQVTDITDEKTIYVGTDISNSLIGPLDISGKTLTLSDGIYRYKDTNEIYTGPVKRGAFVYGHEVDDFYSLNKDTIWTITTAATQELDRQLQDAKQKIQTLETVVYEQQQDAKQKIQTLETTVNKQQQLIDQLIKDMDEIKASMNH